MEYRGKWIDGHIHIKDEPDLKLTTLIKAMENIRLSSGLEAYAIQSIPSWDEEHVLQNPISIMQKFLYPNGTYFFAGLDYYIQAQKDFKQQAEELIDIGADGWKIIETKPMVGKMIGLKSLTEPQYADFFALLEERQIPIMWHVADPETFWDKSKAPEWALNSGWFYGDGSFPTKEDLYRDVEQILQRYPRLCATFAHMLFLAYDLERLDSLMDKYPQMNVDLTPGCEMYGGFALRPMDWRGFFLKHQNRILFGTDGGWSTGEGMEAKIRHASGHANRVKRFLTAGEELDFDGHIVSGISLPHETAEKILYGNFVRLAGNSPKAINREEAFRYFDKLGESLAASPNKNNMVLRLEEIKTIMLNA